MKGVIKMDMNTLIAIWEGLLELIKSNISIEIITNLVIFYIVGKTVMKLIGKIGDAIKGV